MTEISNKQVFVKTLIFCLAVGLALATYYSRDIILAGLTGAGIGCLASPFLTLMKRKFRVPRALGALILILIILLIFSGMFIAAGQLVANQWENFRDQIPNLIEKSEAWWRGLTNDYPLIRQNLKDFSVAENLKAGATRVLYGVGSGMDAVAGIVLAFFIALYTAIHSDDYFRNWVHLFPKEHRNQVAHLSKKSARSLRSWFSAQLLDMAIVGVITAIGLWIVGVNYWALFGLMTALLAIIPYFGTLITLVLATAITAIEQPDLAFWTLLVFFITQQIEGNIILPLIMKERVKLPEAPLLFFIVFMSFWFGILGIIVAPGVFAIAKTVYLEFAGEPADV